MKRAIRLTLVAACCGALHFSTFAQEQQSDKLNDFISDIGPGPVSAAGLIGVSASAVTDVQGPKDLNFLVQPGGGDRSTGFGVEIAPLRTQWSPVSAADYLSSNGIRLLSSVALSYAENKATHSGADYKQKAVALHMSYYWHRADDPIVVAHEAFAKCTEAQAAQKDLTAGMVSYAFEQRKTRPSADLKTLEKEYKAGATYTEQVTKMHAAARNCASKAAKKEWNAPLIAATIGSANIEPVGGGTRLTLTRSISVSAVLRSGADGAINLVMRHAHKELNLDTIAATQSYARKRFAAARYTHRLSEEGDLFVIAEVSNARATENTATSSAFKYALGVDKKLAEGVWAELRLGRARSQNGSGDENKALFNLKWSPTPTLPALFGPATP